MSTINGPDISATKLDVKPCAACEDGEPVLVQDKGSQALPPLEPLSERKKRLNLTIVRFLASWVACMGVLAVIALLANLEWARPKVEQAMGASFHRQVKLGQIGWMLGLNGLSVWTNRLSMTEADGKPFIVAGESEIGVAFLPLLQKRVIIKHVDFHHPEVFATQLSPGHWNFSDLLVEGPEIHYVEVDDGILHLRNAITDEQLSKSGATGTFANTKWRSYDFRDVSLKLVFPGKNQRRAWPFYLAFKLPRESKAGPYVSEVSLTALCNGPFETWMEHACEIEFRARGIDPVDWRPFLPLPDGVHASLALHFKGKGIVKDFVEGELTGTADDISVNNEGQRLLSAPQAKWRTHASISADKISWDKLTLDVAGLIMESHGTLVGWRSANPQYAAVVSADLHSLSQLSDTSFWRFLPGIAASKQAPELSGAAQVELTMDGDSQSHNLMTRLKANGIPFGHLLSGDAQKNTPFLSLFKITPNAPIAGQVVIDKEQTISLKDVEIPANGSKLKIQGMINARLQKHDVRVVSSDLMLDRFDTARLDEGQAPSLLLSGKIDLDAHLTRDKNSSRVAVSARLKNALFSAGGAEMVRHMTGNVAFDGTSIRFHQVAGAMDNKDGTTGSINLSGFINTYGRDSQCSLVMSGKHVELGQLVAFCRSAHLPISDAAVSNMSGMARDIEITIRGYSKAPQLTLKLTPDNIAYQMAPPRGKTLKPVYISGGTIIFTSDGLELKDLPVTSQTGKLQLSASFVGQGDALTPRIVQVKTGGVAVEEVAQYLNSPDMPEQTRTVFANMVAPLQLKSAQGKVSGELKVVLNSNPPKAACQLDGTVSFSNVNGKVFQQQVPFEHLSGVVAVSANQLQLEDVSFNSGSSHFYVQGDVHNIQVSPIWNLQVSAQFKPEDILSALPAALNKSMSASSGGTLTLRSTLVGDNQSDRITFSTKAPPGCGLQLKGQMWQLCQPAQMPVTLEGAMAVRNDGNSSIMRLEGWRLFIGDSEFQGSGKYQWTADGSGKAVSDLTVTTKSAVPAGIIIGAFFPGTSVSGCSGTVKGTLAFAYSADNLLTHGDFALSKVTVPAWNIKDADGRLWSPRWTLNGTGAGGVSRIQVQMADAIFGGVPLAGLSATIVLEKGAQPRLSVNDGQAAVAGGQVKLTAYYQLESKRWHLDMILSDLQVDEFICDLIEHSGEVTGLADGRISLDSKGANWTEMVSNLSGTGEINVNKGSVPRVAVLQEKLTQSNLLQQGIFGFNLNNVFRTVLPVKAGKFKEVNMSFDIANGVVDIDRLNFVGNDLRLRAAGSWNISSNVLAVEVAGNIPRVSSSLLPGAVGEVSRSLTIQKAVRVVTFRKLENLPTVPILGDIGTDDPRAFTFKAASSANNSNALQQSISRSFRWLPNKPNASAHPIPGLPNVSLNSASVTSSL